MVNRGGYDGLSFMKYHHLDSTKTRPTQAGQDGYTMIILIFAIFVLTLALMAAVPVWQTQIQREKEAELIFRGGQYVEAVRLFQLKNPGRFPESVDQMIEAKCLRRRFPDPMVFHGEWNFILPYQAGAGQQQTSSQKVLVVPGAALSSFDNPQIIGVVSSSGRKSKRLYMEQESYDKWLFYYGQDPKQIPEIEYYGAEEE